VCVCVCGDFESVAPERDDSLLAVSLLMALASFGRSFKVSFAFLESSFDKWDASFVAGSPPGVCGGQFCAGSAHPVSCVCRHA